MSVILRHDYIGNRPIIQKVVSGQNIGDGLAADDGYINENGEARVGKIITHAVILLFVLSILFGSFKIIGAGERGVRITLGQVSDDVLGEGLQFKWPFVQKIKKLDVKIQKEEILATAASKDLQNVSAQIALNYHLEADKVNRLWQGIGNEYKERVIDPAIQEAVKAVTAKYTAEELISKRIDVRNDIVATLTERLDRHGLKIDEFSILNFNFSKSFNEAIEAKTTAEQLKLKAERDLQRIQVEGQQKIVSAKAEAEGLAAQRQQITPELLELRKIENERVAIEKWNGALPTYTGNTMPFLNLK